MLSTPFGFQIVFTPKPMHRTESTTLVLSLQKFPRTAVMPGNDLFIVWNRGWQSIVPQSDLIAVKLRWTFRL
jgi:hypothetical protein